MATASAQPNERECPVCINDFTTPKVLPCGHLLCRECLISWVDSNPKAGCPLCRCPIEEQSGRSSSETVDALPTDFVMEALVESARVLSKDHLCWVCDDNKANSICMQCLKRMCAMCAKIHRKRSKSRCHDVESLTTVTPERLAASRPALCADHGDKQADIFCFCHQLAVCKSCESKKHRKFPKVSDFDDEIHSAENSLNHMTKILVEAEEKLEQAIGQLTSRLQEVDVSEQEDMAQVDKACDRLQKLVEDFRKKLKEKTRTSHLQIRNSLRDIKTDLNNRLGKVTSHKHIVTRATAVSPRPALIHMRQTLTDRVNSLDLSADLKPLSSAGCCQEVVGRIEQELLMWEQKAETKIGHRVKLDAQPPVLVFHENCSKNICLTNWNTTAEKIDAENMSCDGVIVSRDVMASDVLYEVRVDAMSGERGMLRLGVTGVPPKRLVVTKWYTDTEGSVVIRANDFYHQSKCLLNTFGECLRKLQVGSRVGLLVDSSNDLHLYVDGQHKGVAAEHVTQPCFAVFHIWHRIIKVTALPTSRKT